MYPLDLKRTGVWLFSFVGTLVLYAIAGIVGNRADDGFLWLFSNLNTQYSISPTLAIIVAVFTITPLSLSIWRYRRAHRINSLLNGLDESLFRLLVLLDKGPQRLQEINKLVDEFLQDLADLFDSINEGCRISIYRPDRDRRSYLRIWRSLRMPTESVDRTEFYVGNRKNNHVRGVAGAVYLERTTRVVHFNKVHGQWTVDDQEYCLFKDSIDPAYRSFIAVPLLGPKDKPIGVLCIDAKSPKIFDTDTVRKLVLSIGQRLASALVIAESCGVPNGQKPSQNQGKTSRSRR